MKKIKIINFLTIASLPFTFVSCQYLANTKWPNPIDQRNSLQYIGGGYWKGMKDWESIRDKLSNKDTPDYCIASRIFGYYLLECSQRIDKTKTFEEAHILYTHCSKNYDENEISCSQSKNDFLTRKPRKIEDIKEYKKNMRYAGSGKPSIIDIVNTNFRILLEIAAIISFLCFPFLSLASLFYLIKTIKKRFKK